MWFQSIFIVTILVVVGQSRLMDIDMDTVCEGKADNTYVRSATSCHHYLICTDGKVSAEKTCSDGLGFVASKEMCGPLNEAGCRDYLLRSFDATDDDDDDAYENDDIDDNENYESVGSDDDNEGQGVEAELEAYVCIGVVDGTLVPSPASCGSYYRCNGDVPVEEECPEGHAFNEDMQRCDPENEVDCSLCADEGQYMLADPKNCNLFYYCDGYVRDKYACPNGERYDSVESRCRPRAEFQCVTENLCRFHKENAINFLVADLNDCKK